MRPLLVLSAALMLTSPAAARQDVAGDKVNQLIVYGDDDCQPAAENEITICARKPESERFRIPEILRGTVSPQNEAWTNRVIAYETVGISGTMSCSATGSGGWTGCAHQLIDAAYAEKSSDPNLKFSEMIAAERAKRMVTIDAEAAEMQARVEYEAKRKEERGGGANEGQSQGPSQPQTPGN